MEKKKSLMLVTCFIVFVIKGKKDQKENGKNRHYHVGRRLPSPRFLNRGFPAGRRANAEAEAWEVLFKERRVHGKLPLSCLKTETC